MTKPKNGGKANGNKGPKRHTVKDETDAMGALAVALAGDNAVRHETRQAAAELCKAMGLMDDEGKLTKKAHQRPDDENDSDN